MVDNNNSINNINMLNNHHHHHHNHDHHHDDLLPIANVGRVMKRALPASAKVSKEAKEKMQEYATEFVSFVTGEAADRCRRERRKTLNGDDLCWALHALGFDHYAGPLGRYLRGYREAEGDRAHHERAIKAAAATEAVDRNYNGGGGEGGGEG